MGGERLRGMTQMRSATLRRRARFSTVIEGGSMSMPSLSWPMAGVQLVLGN